MTGGSDPAEAMTCPKLYRFLRGSSRQGTRMTSVCTGSASAGLQDGKAATTHWPYARRFERQSPLVQRQTDSNFVRDGHNQRLGGQSQFSSLLEDSRFGGRFEALLDHVRTHLRDPLTVVDLTAKSGVSPRNFSLCFTQETESSPARTVERVRAECARAQLFHPSCSVAEVASNCGFGSGERMQRALLRLYGLGPTALRTP